jgi:hypothetical protein
MLIRIDHVFIRRSVSFFGAADAPFQTSNVIIITSLSPFYFIQPFRLYCTNLNPSRWFYRDCLHVYIFVNRQEKLSGNKNAPFLLNSVFITLITNQLNFF